MKALKHKSSLTPKKRAIFITFTLILPLVAIGLLEIALRILGYGPNISLFSTETIHGKTYYTMNPDIKHRYFSQVEFSPSTSPEYFPLLKDKNTFRIFCLGASTTVGYPYWYNASFPSCLRDRLCALFPEKKIEVINLGLTATNSYSVNDIAAELPEYQPDLLIVYDGHNEFYGALGAASRESIGHSRWIVKLYLRLLHMKTFLLARNTLSSLGSLFSSVDPDEARGTMMERMSHGKYIPYGSSQYLSALQDFRDNLRELENICMQSRIPLILTSQVSNLRNHRPFNSGDPLSPLLHREYEKAQRYYDGNSLDSALMLFRSILATDSLRADIHYGVARCLDRQGRFSEANQEYIKARDFDQLRFRGSTDFNRAIRDVCGDGKAIFADMEGFFMSQSADSLIGNELIMEHLHPNARGYFLMAKYYADCMRSFVLLATAEEWKRADTLNEDRMWGERPSTELDDRLAMRKTQVLTAAWPFTENTVPIVPALSAQDSLGEIAEKMARNQWDWRTGHERAAELYLKRGDQLQAAKEFKVLINQVPTDVQPYLQLAHVYLGLQDISSLKAILLASLQVERTILAYRALGDIALRQGNPDAAISYYEGMSQFRQEPVERIQNAYLLALAHFKAGQSDVARAQVLMLLNSHPDYGPAVELLSQISNTARHSAVSKK